MIYGPTFGAQFESVPKRRLEPYRPRDMNQLAHHIGALATGQIGEEHSPAPTKLQERAAKGGKARAAKLSRKKRVAIARKGGQASARRKRR